MKTLHPFRRIFMLLIVFFQLAIVWLVVADWLPGTTPGRRLLGTVGSTLGF